MRGVVNTEPKFLQRTNALGDPQLYTIQKCVASMRMLCYDNPADGLDEYIRMGESTIQYYFDLFVCAVSK